jgi:pimeloyl-ACP methyl ester carboxylesterase
MSLIEIDGVRLNYDDLGKGPAVLFIAGSGARGRTWHLHQVPALVAAGYRVVTFDNRGIAPSDTPAKVTMADLVADAAGLIERLGLAPARVVGSSLGARIAAELSLTRPDLVDRAVLMATRGRTDAYLEALIAGERALHDSGVRLPGEYLAVVRAAQNLSRRTLADDRAVQDWLDVFQLPLPDTTAASELDIDMKEDRLGAYGEIAVPCLVVGFADDLLAPPERGREVAAAIPGARYTEIADAGHYGYLERPEPVNAALLHHFTHKEPT